MICTVYKLKRDGERLPIEEAKAVGVRGDLQFLQRRPSGMPAVEATLLDPQGQQIMSMRSAEVRRIEGATILIRGGEPTGGGWIDQPQVWLCVLDSAVQT